MVYHSKATDCARLAEMVRLPKMFEKLGSIFLEVTRRFFAELVGFPKIFCLSNRALFPCANLKRHNRVYILILLSKHTYRPMRARVVAQLFYKHASIIVSYASTELDFPK